MKNYEKNLSPEALDKKISFASDIVLKKIKEYYPFEVYLETATDEEIGSLMQERAVDPSRFVANMEYKYEKRVKQLTVKAVEDLMGANFIASLSIEGLKKESVISAISSVASEDWCTPEVRKRIDQHQKDIAKQRVERKALKVKK